MRTTTTVLLLTTALLGGATTAAVAQEAPKPAATTADSAEDAFLKAYFSEKELKDYAAAEKAYAAVIDGKPDSREVLARSLLGRARSLRELKHTDDADALFARVEKEFADIKDAANEAHDARQASAGPAGAQFETLIHSNIRSSDWQSEVWKYGERGVPTLVAMLRDDSPDLVYRAAESLARMDVPAASDALVAALDSKSSTYPQQVRSAAESDWVSVSAMKRLTSTKDTDIRAHALSRLVYRVGDPNAIESVVAETALRTSYIKDNNASETYGRLLAAALAHGGEARDAALLRLRGDPLPGNAVGGLVDPPAAVLADSQSLVLLAPLMTNWVRRSSTTLPSPTLVAAFLRQPETAAAGVFLTLALRRPSADPAEFADAVARAGFGKTAQGADWPADELADRLIVALGARPSSDVLKRMAAAWPDYRNWDVERRRLPEFLSRLIASGVDDEPSLRAFQDGLPLAHHEAFTETLVDTRRGAKPVGAWAADAFLRELAMTPGDHAHEAAARGLDEWQEQFGDACGLATKTQQIVAALGAGGTDHLTIVLRRIGPSSIDALKAALPTHPRKAYVVQALVALGDRSSADAIERVVAELSEIADEDERKDALMSAVASLVKVRGDAALDALSAALVAHDGRAAANVLEAVGNLPDGGVAFGDGPRFALCKLALEKAPRALRESSIVADSLPRDRRRELAVLAMKSADPHDRFWGVNTETKLLDVEAWDALLVAAQDADDDVRDTAREALRAIRAKESELAEFRAMGEERATRKRIEALLASPNADVRCAGVAAVAATGFAGMVNDLIRLAAEDGSVDVRDAARKALLAMAKPAAPATSPAEKK